jgi:ABC-type multidrug transport system permease subunit
MAEGWPAVWDGMFFVLLVAFLLGSLSLGLLAANGLERATGILLLLSVPLSILIIPGEYWNVRVASRLEAIIYPRLQPVSRVVTEVWLWSCRVPNKMEPKQPT